MLNIQNYRQERKSIDFSLLPSQAKELDALAMKFIPYHHKSEILIEALSAIFNKMEGWIGGDKKKGGTKDMVSALRNALEFLDGSDREDVLAMIEALELAEEFA